MSLTYRDCASFVHDGLIGLRYVDAPGVGDLAMPALSSGPVTTARLMNLSPGSIIFLQLGGGAGLTTEGLFDRVMLTLLVIGDQGDFDGAEQLALDVDRVLAGGVGGNTQVGGTGALYVTRTGGRPSLADLDSGERYHFTGSYIIEAQSDLVR